MIRFRWLVPALALCTVGLTVAVPAHATPQERVTALIKKGHTTQAITVAHKSLARNPGDNSLQTLLAKAYFAHAASYNSVASWQDFRRRYPDGKWHEEAYKREARAAWRDILGEYDREKIAAYRKAYPTGVLEDEAKRIEANLHFRDASLDNSVEAWSGFVAKFPEDPRAKKAVSKMEIAALSAAREGDDVKQLRQFLVDYPDSPRRGEVMRDLIALTTVLHTGCPGKPPQCAVIQPGTELTAKWEPIENVPITATFMAWSQENGEKPIDQAFSEWAGEGWEIESQQVASKFVGTTEANTWRLSLEFPLKRPGKEVDGYALKVQAEGAAPTFMPFKVHDVYPAPPNAAKVLIVRQPTQLVTKAADGNVNLATVPDIPLNDENKGLHKGRFFYAWGDNGIARVDLDSGAVDRFVGGRPVHKAWVSGTNLFYEMQAGNTAELVMVDENGNQRTRMPTPGRPDAPREFRTMAVGQEKPVSVLHLTGRGWGWVPIGQEARPLATPASIPKERESASVAVDPQGEQAAFFVNDKRSRIVMVRLSDARSTEFAVDTKSLFNAETVTWGRAAWSIEHGLVAECFGARNRLMGVVKLDKGNVTVVDDETLELALGKEKRPADVAPGTLAFEYQQPLEAYLR